MSDARDTPRAGIVVPVAELTPVLDFLTESIGFLVEDIFPADDPRRCTVFGFGSRLHLELGTPRPTTIRLRTTDPELLNRGLVRGPDALNIEFENAEPDLHLPPLVSSFSITHAADSWHTGRAGMNYRDLVPDRQGGAVIASHIRIPGAGPVSDYVHFHDIAFQLIFCRRGQVTVVYEDQGEPFVLTAGDCVTQPPRIRHRVLESSDDLEVIEIGYPAEHITRADPSISLPTATFDPSRSWDGQTFVRHRRSTAPSDVIAAGVTRTDTGVARGTHDLADVSQIDIDASTWECPQASDKEFVLLVALEGTGEGRVDGDSTSESNSLAPASALVVPVGHHATVTSTGRLSLLQVRIRTI
ncbi:MAG: cupin domain-containing protein [Actinomycetota bacterium]